MNKKEFYVNDIALLKIREYHVESGEPLKVFVRVKILKVKSAYGNTRYVITPVDGIGEMTVQNLEANK